MDNMVEMHKFLEKYSFPKPVLALDFLFSLSDSESYQGYIDHLKKFLVALGAELGYLFDYFLVS